MAYLQPRMHLSLLSSFFLHSFFFNYLFTYLFVCRFPQNDSQASHLPNSHGEVHPSRQLCHVYDCILKRQVTKPIPSMSLPFLPPLPSPLLPSPPPLSFPPFLLLILLLRTTAGRNTRCSSTGPRTTRATTRSALTFRATVPSGSGVAHASTTQWYAWERRREGKRGEGERRGRN